MPGDFDSHFHLVSPISTFSIGDGKLDESTPTRKPSRVAPSRLIFYSLILRQGKGMPISKTRVLRVFSRPESSSHLNGHLQRRKFFFTSIKPNSFEWPYPTNGILLHSETGLITPRANSLSTSRLETMIMT